VTATESAKIKYAERLPALAFDQTGDKIFLSEQRAGEIILHDLGTGEGAALLRGHQTDTPGYYAFDDKIPFCLSDDKKKILAAVHRKMRAPDPVVDQWALELHDAGTGETLQEFEGLEKEIYAVCLSPDGRSAATLSFDKERLKIWDVGTGKCVASLMNVCDTNVTGVSYSPDGKMMVVALHPWLISKKDSVVVMDAGTQEILHKFEHKKNSGLVAAPVFNPEGTAVFSASDAIEAWDLSTGRQIKRIPVASTISHLCHSPDGKIFLAAGAGALHLFDAGADALHLFDVGSFGLLQTIALSGVDREPVDDVCFSSDGTKIAASRGGEIIVFELDQDLDFPGWADWDDGASPFVETFLTLRPNHTEADFFDLLAELGRLGYGWLRPDGVRARVAALVKKRKKGFFSRLFGKK
jgi:WD40 repeat protein